MFTLYNIVGAVSYNWFGMDGFEVKRENERFTVVCPRCYHNLKFGDFMSKLPQKCEVKWMLHLRLFMLF